MKLFITFIDFVAVLSFLITALVYLFNGDYDRVALWLILFCLWNISWKLGNM